MKLGTAYYPEQYPHEMWRTHLEKIAQAGIQTIRLGEFAWSTFCPAEGVYAWDWLDTCLTMAAQLNLEVILCTPTAAPPIWLVEAHPEILPVDDEGHRMVFGKRQHRCYHAPSYLEQARKLVLAMAERYGQHPQVVAWQIDNELGGERTRCCCDLCETAFQQWLEQAYDHDIDRLNRAWGTAFWSQTYQRFNQIRVPLRVDNQLWLKHNPGLELAFWRFCSRSITDFAGMQAGWLRTHARQPITTNTDPFFYGDAVHLPHLFKEMDVCSMDVYSDKPYEIAFYADLAHSLKNRAFWMMEFGVSSPTLPAQLDLLSAHGCAFTGLFSFLQFPWGQEQHTPGLLTLTGKPRPNWHALQTWARSHSIVPPEPFSPYAPCLPEGLSHDKKPFPEVGLYYHFESSWMLTLSNWLPGEEKWVYPRTMLHTVYQALYRAGRQIRFFFSPEQVGAVKILAVPRHVMWDPLLEKRLEQFVCAGGLLLMTTDLFKKDSHNAYLTSAPSFFHGCCGCAEGDFPEETDAMAHPLPAGAGFVWMLGSEASLERWREAFLEACHICACTP